MAGASSIERELTALEADLKRLEAEYNMFFAGRLPRPPWETRARVDATIKRLDRSHISNYGERFRFTTLQSRYAALIDLWDRGLRSREEGRPGPFARPRSTPAPEPPRPRSQVVHVATFSDSAGEPETLRGLYQSLMEARRSAGQGAIPFDRFADLIRTQLSALRESGGADVAFRVAVKDGKVNLTARALRGGKSEE